ncbi:hypothetical protein BTH160X_100044 [Brochothrix thermosphacta]|uniref:Uncharacterized protein n=1 Tax=Brochothrix thermosphacta TaxID=2756 RepID=A0A2X0QXW7_BROTH|nr:hypothetical protein BTH160X_100044 [Brochothrix thermosphacta]SPP29038.1 hypothetical protein BTBSAS_40061 [Brochothrix thermosphacta]
MKKMASESAVKKCSEKVMEADENDDVKKGKRRFNRVMSSVRK